MSSPLFNIEGQKKRCGFFFLSPINFFVHQLSHRLSSIIKLTKQIYTQKMLFRGMLSSAKGKRIELIISALVIQFYSK